MTTTSQKFHKFLSLLQNLSSIVLNQKSETAETEFHDKNSGETRLLEQETILVESKELGQDSNSEPQGQLHEASGDRYDEKKNENESQACESTENSTKRVVTTEQSLETSENEIEKLEKVHELGSQDQLEIKDGEMSIKEDKPEKEEAWETEKHKSEITDDDNAKCHTGESGLETISSTDFLHEKMEQEFQAGSLHEAATALKDEEDEKKNTTNDEITCIEKVTDEEIIRANATNPSSEVINEETVEGYLQIDKETDVSKGENIEEQIIEGTSTACISLEAVEETPIKNFKSDKNNIDKTSSREILLESETAEIVGGIENEAKRSTDEIPDSTLQSSLVQEQDILHIENLIISEGSSADGISMTNDKENHTDQPQADTGEHGEIVKDVEYLEQIMKKNEDKENNEQLLNVISAETVATLSQSNKSTVQERVDLPQDDESETGTAKEENITNGSYIGSALQEADDEDPVIFQTNEIGIGKSNAEITGESIAAATCKNIASETGQNAECLIETIPTSLTNTTASDEFFETSTYAKDDIIIEYQEQNSDKKETQEALVDIDDIRNEIPEEESLPSRELNEKIEITESETPVNKINGLNVTHSLEKELGEFTKFETQKQVHEAIGGGDEVKNDETESQACKGTENADSQHLSAKGAENTETSEAETEKLEKVHASESKEEVENKDVQMSIEENIGKKEESCEEDIQKLETKVGKALPK
ncbi:uncharacterized protein [Euphorbia lathyris]|uniref:uncharacterized protein n=1 Tax=Euphorbia lathyris TaxID=212925 RepID=UPI0033140E70